MTRLIAALVVLAGLAACSSERQARVQPLPSDRTTVVTTAPGAVAPATRDTFQGVGRPL